MDMDKFFFVILFICGLVVLFWFYFKSSQSQKQDEIRHYISEVAKDREVKCYVDPVDIPAAPLAEDTSLQPETLDSISEPEIEICADGSWICPNDETKNTGDVCIICGLNRSMYLPGRSLPASDVVSVPETTRNNRNVVALKNGFSTAYSPEQHDVTGYIGGEVDIILDDSPLYADG